jgi:hypothetical protein
VVLDLVNSHFTVHNHFQNNSHGENWIGETNPRHEVKEVGKEGVCEFDLVDLVDSVNYAIFCKKKFL